MKKNMRIGLLLGTVAGVLDVIPMVTKVYLGCQSVGLFSVDRFGLYAGDL